jgi:hypothetical protein
MEKPSPLFTILGFTDDKKLHDFDMTKFPNKFQSIPTFVPVYRYSEDNPLPEEATSDHAEVMLKMIVDDGSRFGNRFCCRSWNVANPAHSKYLGWNCVWRDTHIAHENAFSDDKGQKQYENIRKHQFESVRDAFKNGLTDVFTLVEVHPTRFYDHLIDLKDFKTGETLIHKTVYDKNSKTRKDEDLSVVMLHDSSDITSYYFHSVFKDMGRPMQACDVRKKDQSFMVISMHAEGAGSQYNHQYYKKLGPELIKLVESRKPSIIIMGGDWNTPPAILDQFGKKLSAQLPKHDVKIVFPSYLTHVNPCKPEGTNDQFYATRYDGFMIVYPTDISLSIEAGSVDEIGYSSQKMVKSISTVDKK